MNVKGTTFEVKQYSFRETPEGSTDIFKSRAELFDKYKDNKEITIYESLKLYAYFIKM